MMIKLEYKVLKEFSIVKDEKGVRNLGKIDDTERSASSFAKGSQYVDYDFPDYGITQGELTTELIEKEYIKLVNTITKK